MPKYYVRKDGRVCQLYTTPFTDWANPPVDEFPQTLLGVENLQGLQAQMNGNDYVLIDRPAPAAPPSSEIPKLPLAAILGALAGMTGVPEAEKQALAEKMRSSPSATGTMLLENDKLQPRIAHVIQASELQDRMLQQFKVVLASVIDDQTKAEAEGVGNFILEVCPDLADAIVQISQAKQKRKFSL